MPRHATLARILLCAPLPFFALPALAAEDAPPPSPLAITVYGQSQALDETSTPSSSTSSIGANDPDTGPILETGDLLRNLPGVTASRAGGHGFEPVIRGQQQNQLTVIDNGSQIFGACPGRMDPPTTLARPGDYDQITVIRGYQTVTNGPGASGGTILLEKRLPPMDRPFSGSAWAGFESNGLGSSTGFTANAVHEGYFASGEGSWTRAENYEDGDGRDVRSAFKQVGGGLTLGRVANDGSFLEANISKSAIRDALFNGMMDSPKTDTFSGRVRAKYVVDDATLKLVEGNFYGNDVDHLMDNYSLRDVTGMYMKTDAHSRTFGGKLSASLDLFGASTEVGVDGRTNKRSAQSYMGMMAPSPLIRTYSWPDISITELGLFGETTIPVTENTRLITGARMDFVYTTAGAADSLPGAAIAGARRTANSLYSAYYGETYGDRVELNLGGLARLEHDLSNGITLNAGLSRSVRTADATERGIASGFGSTARVGNPDIHPEKHHQVDIGASWKNARGDNAFIASYVNLVDDYILADHARGEYGVLRSDGALIYHNTTALLTGIEAGVNHRVFDDWLVSADLAWTFGQDLKTNRPLDQIPPLTMGLGATYDGGGWTLGGKVRGALTQNRVDTNSLTGTGQDVRKTPGWVTLDLHGTITEFDPVEISFGATNLLDATYSNHLNKAATFEPNDIQVNEPGRSFYLKATVRF
ncbi:TonB-dependent receptor domain-containing protein [Rhodospirillum sp. A1_3_36]|uniref:TonB-dependent receptor domain-containing protein n=1 Tax=Rhodospirillum sp. A1_3_36 TaxID=3391666 RepID=UPI0039A67F58